MMYCSDGGRAVCPDLDRCGQKERPDFAEGSWCEGFNAGVTAAQSAVNRSDPISKLDRAFNRMRKQLDYMVFALEWQTKALQRLLNEPEDDGSRQSQHSDDQRCNGDAERPGR